MTKEEIINQLNTIFRDTLNNADINLTDATTAHDIEEWDSLNNIYLILNIETHFGIKFLTSEMQEWQNVGDMIKSIKK